MDRRRKLIFVTYAITAFAVLVYFVVKALDVPESASIGLLFFPIWVVGTFLLLACIETLVFLLIFLKSFRELRGLLLPMLGLSSLAPIGICIMLFLTREPEVVVPPPGTLPVSQAQFTQDKRTVEETFRGEHLDRLIREDRIESLLSVETDTIFYSPDLKQIFAWVAIDAVIEHKRKVVNAYLTGRAMHGRWSLGRPKGNTWYTYFDSRSSMHDELLKYYYARYTINGSDPEKPDIWKDKYIFPIAEARDQ